MYQNVQMPVFLYNIVDSCLSLSSAFQNHYLHDNENVDSLTDVS